MFESHIIAHPWDLEDGRVEPLLDWTAGELGATGLTLVVSGHARTRIRVHPAKDPTVIRTRGGFFFTPENSWFKTTRCHPPTAESAKGWSRLEQVAEQVRNRGLRWRVELSATRVGTLAQRHPEAAIRNILGDTSPIRLCLANPDVREMIGTLCRHLSAEPIRPDAIVLSELENLTAGYTAGECRLSHPHADLLDGLLAICTCEACHRHAGHKDFDLASLIESARAHCVRLLHEGSATPGQNLRHAEAEIRRYEHWRRKTVLADLIENADSALDPDVVIIPRPCAVAPDAAAPGWSTGTAILPAAPGAPDAADITSREGRPDALELEFDLAKWMSGRPQDLVAAIRNAATRPAAAVNIRDAGLMPSPIADAVKQGIRYARRSADA